MPVCWTTRKTNSRFPSLPTALGNRRGTISTFPPPRRGVEKWKTKGRFPTFPLVVFFLKPTQKKEARRRIASLPPSGSFLD